MVVKIVTGSARIVVKTVYFRATYHWIEIAKIINRKFEEGLSEEEINQIFRKLLGKSLGSWFKRFMEARTFEEAEEIWAGGRTFEEALYLFREELVGIEERFRKKQSRIDGWSARRGAHNNKRARVSTIQPIKI